MRQRQSSRRRSVAPAVRELFISATVLVKARSLLPDLSGVVDVAGLCSRVAFAE